MKEDNLMEFETLLESLRYQTFEDIIRKYNEEKGSAPVEVECIGNQVYGDIDLSDFLKSLGAEITDYNDGYALIETDKGKYYEVSYGDFKNRFGDDLPNETILYFDIERIYDVTNNYN